MCGCEKHRDDAEDHTACEAALAQEVTRAESAEAERDALWEQVDRDQHAAMQQAERAEKAEAERDYLRARVRELAEEWRKELDTGAISDPDARHCWSTAEREVRALLTDAFAPEPVTADEIADVLLESWKAQGYLNPPFDSDAADALADARAILARHELRRRP